MLSYPEVETGTVFFGAFNDPTKPKTAAPCAVRLVLEVELRTCPMPASLADVTLENGWVFQKTREALEIRATPSATGLPWVSFALAAPVFPVKVYTKPSEEEGIGIQAVIMDYTMEPQTFPTPVIDPVPALDPAPAPEPMMDPMMDPVVDPAAVCFGGGTLVLCSDGVRRRVRDLGPRAVLAAKDPTGSWSASVPVWVYKSPPLESRPLSKTWRNIVCCVAEDVWVTGDHTVVIPHVLRPANICPVPEVGHGLGERSGLWGCAWVAKSLPDFHAKKQLVSEPVFHLVPMDPAHRLFWAVVGKPAVTGAPPPILAELYRSPAAVIERCFKYSMHA
jgi:hypothetical protein